METSQHITAEFPWCYLWITMIFNEGRYLSPLYWSSEKLSSFKNLEFLKELYEYSSNATFIMPGSFDGTFVAFMPL